MSLLPLLVTAWLKYLHQSRTAGSQNIVPISPGRGTSLCCVLFSSLNATPCTPATIQLGRMMRWSGISKWTLWSNSKANVTPRSEWALLIYKGALLPPSFLSSPPLIPLFLLPIFSLVHLLCHLTLRNSTKQKKVHKCFKVAWSGMLF